MKEVPHELADDYEAQDSSTRQLAAHTVTLPSSGKQVMVLPAEDVTVSMVKGDDGNYVSMLVSTDTFGISQTLKPSEARRMAEALVHVADYIEKGGE